MGARRRVMRGPSVGKTVALPRPAPRPPTPAEKPTYPLPMPRSSVDESVERVVVEGFAFPLGVYPVEPMTPRPGFRSDFEPADGGEDDGQWEAWPDRYVYEIVISADRLEPLVRSLLALMPGRIYPILDVLGRDAFREVDPYISYDLMGIDRLMDALRRYRAFFFEDGLCGFGVMADEPFLYIFVDEHKIITIRVEPHLKDKIEKVLAAFDLEPVEEPAGADAAAHEHRSVLSISDDRPDLLDEDEITEVLREEWKLVLNVDPDTNVDDEGNDLGITGWRCILRCAEDAAAPARYADIVMTARNLRRAEELAQDAIDDLRQGQELDEIVPVACDRVDRETFAQWLLSTTPEVKPGPDEERIIWSRWIE